MAALERRRKGQGGGGEGDGDGGREEACRRWWRGRRDGEDGRREGQWTAGGCFGEEEEECGRGDGRVKPVTTVVVAVRSSSRRKRWKWARDGVGMLWWVGDVGGGLLR
jgi:hypothetical protein